MQANPQILQVGTSQFPILILILYFVRVFSSERAILSSVLRTPSVLDQSFPREF